MRIVRRCLQIKKLWFGALFFDAQCTLATRHLVTGSVFVHCFSEFSVRCIYLESLHVGLVFLWIM